MTDEKIKLAEGGVDRLTEHAVVLADGTRLQEIPTHRVWEVHHPE